ncbi:YfbR-like 5'-deoxynucleotidase [Campylobacter showae]|uniref:YfbR-like 5'-deoxynucleotidase n=1 Tax=Campylobacter showae TaxID=204 RepID=UPI000F09284D|nr:YfbR-like 5'-deoxynucleotidase [Campylobacter showae]
MSENLKEVFSRKENQAMGKKFIGIKLVEEGIENGETIYSYNGNRVENTVEDLEDVADLLVNADGVENIDGKKVYFEVTDSLEETVKDLRSKFKSKTNNSETYINSIKNIINNEQQNDFINKIMLPKITKAIADANTTKAELIFKSPLMIEALSQAGYIGIEMGTFGDQEPYAVLKKENEDKITDDGTIQNFDEIHSMLQQIWFNDQKGIANAIGFDKLTEQISQDLNNVLKSDFIYNNVSTLSENPFESQEKKDNTLGHLAALSLLDTMDQDKQKLTEEYLSDLLDSIEDHWQILDKDYQRNLYSNIAEIANKTKNTFTIANIASKFKKHATLFSKNDPYDVEIANKLNYIANEIIKNRGVRDDISVEIESTPLVTPVVFEGTKIKINGKMVDLKDNEKFVNMYQRHNNNGTIKFYVSTTTAGFLNNTLVIDYDPEKQEITKANRYGTDLKTTIAMDNYAYNRESSFAMFGKKRIRKDYLADMKNKTAALLDRYIPRDLEPLKQGLKAFGDFTKVFATRVANLMINTTVAGAKFAYDASQKALIAIKEKQPQFQNNIDGLKTKIKDSAESMFSIMKEKVFKAFIKEPKDITSLTLGKLVKDFDTSHLSKEEFITKVSANLLNSKGFLGSVDYSTLQHSLNVAKITNHYLKDVNLTKEQKNEIVLKALMHDMVEAIAIGDLPTPLKDQMPKIRDFEDKILKKLNEKLGLKDTKYDNIIKLADKQERATFIQLHFTEQNQKNLGNMIGDYVTKVASKNMKLNSEEAKAGMGIIILNGYKEFLEGKDLSEINPETREFIKYNKMDKKEDFVLSSKTYLEAKLDMNLSKDPYEILEEVSNIVNELGITIPTEKFKEAFDETRFSEVNLAFLDKEERNNSIIAQAEQLFKSKIVENDYSIEREIEQGQSNKIKF